MSRYINPLLRGQPSKRSPFRFQCGGCGKPIHRHSNSKNKMGYICHTCRPLKHRSINEQICSVCPFEMECIARVKLGVWLRCEIPDMGDLERLAYRRGINDEETYSQARLALSGRGDRLRLEAAVARITMLTYQIDTMTRKRRRGL